MQECFKHCNSFRKTKIKKMKKTKIYFVVMLLIVSNGIKAQMKVGDNPTVINSNAVLHVESSNKGLLLPKIALTSTSSFAPLTAHVAGMTVYNTATAGDVTPGFYYNDGSKWVMLASTSQEPWYVGGTNTPATSNTQKIYQTGFVGIRTNDPVPTAFTPKGSLHVRSQGNQEGDNIIIESFGNGGGILESIPSLVLQSANGTVASPLNLTNGHVIGGVNYQALIDGKYVNPTSAITATYKGNGMDTLSDLKFGTSHKINMILDEKGYLSLANGKMDAFDPEGGIHVRSFTETGNNLILESFVNSTLNPQPVSSVILRGSKGTPAAPANLTNNFHIGSLNFQARVNGAYQNEISSISSFYTGSGIDVKSKMTFRTSNQERMQIADNGSVGIGVTGTPATKLHVVGNAITVTNSEATPTNLAQINSDGGLLLIRDKLTNPIAPNTGGYIDLKNYPAPGIYNARISFDAGISTNGALLFQLTNGQGSTTATNVMSIQSNGNVNIGNLATAVAKESLTVSGSLNLNSGYGVSGNGATSPVPAGGEGTITYYNGHFYGWNGTAWKQLDN